MDINRTHEGVDSRADEEAFSELKKLNPFRKIPGLETGDEPLRNDFASGRKLRTLDWGGFTETFWSWTKMFHCWDLMGTLRFVAGCFVFLAVVSLFVFPRLCAAADSGSDVIAYQSPYVWSVDGKGDFILPVIAEKMEYISQPVSVKDTITSVTAVWEASGPVAVFVSADAGLHYTPAVNGVPLTSGFTSGETLKWKAVLGTETALLEMRLAFTSAGGVAGTFGSPELSGFGYRKPVKISGSSPGTLYYYQVVVRVGESAGSVSADVSCNGRVMADFNDIRFTAADGETLLAHALVGVAGRKPNRTADYFVRVPQIPPEGVTLFLYYGHATARPLSSPEDTFDFYEDFTTLDGKIDTEKWSLTLGTGGSVQATPEGLLLDAATLTARTFEFKEGIIEYAARAVTGYETRLVARDPDPARATDVTLVAYASGLDGAQHCLVVDNIVKANDPKPIAAGTYYGYRLLADRENNLAFERYDESFLKREAAVSYQDKEGPARGFLALKTAGSGLGRSLTTFRWIRGRKQAAPEPAVDPASLNAAEESPALPIFTNVVLDGRKNLILASGAKSGRYTTPETRADFDIRILVPAWEGRGVSVAVSGDGGKSYKKECADNAYYYVSKGDFAAGRVLRGRLDLKKEGDSAPFASYVSFAYRPGSLVLLEPNGGLTVSTGATLPISWTAWDYEASYPMKLEYSLDGGRTYLSIAPATANTGTYFWRVPDAHSVSALVRISDALDPGVLDVSDGVFFIKRPEGPSVGEKDGVRDPGYQSTGVSGSQSAAGARKDSQPRKKDEQTLRRRPGTKPYDILIKKGASGSFEEGDIVMIKPAGFLWGASERNNFSIIRAYLTDAEAEEFMKPQEAAGARGADGSPEKNVIRQRRYRIDLRKEGVLKRRAAGAASEGPVLDTSEIVDKSQTTAK